MSRNFIYVCVCICQNCICDDIRQTERNTDVLLNACKDIGLAVNKRKTEHMKVGRYWDMKGNGHIKIVLTFMKK